MHGSFHGAVIIDILVVLFPRRYVIAMIPEIMAIVTVCLLQLDTHYNLEISWC
jgi:hypothetical protein